MEGAVDLARYPPTVVTDPLRIQVSPAAVGIAADRLLRGHRQTVTSAQAHEVDLAQRLCARCDVLDSVNQCAAMTQPRFPVQRSAQIARREQALLDAGREDPTRRPWPDEAARREDQRIRGRLYLAACPQSGDGRDGAVQDHDWVGDLRRGYASGSQDMYLRSFPAPQARVFSCREGRENRTRATVQHAYLPPILAGERAVVQRDRPPDAAPPPRRNTCPKLRVGAASAKQLGSRDDLEIGVGDKQAAEAAATELMASASVPATSSTPRIVAVVDDLAGCGRPRSLRS